MEQHLSNSDFAAAKAVYTLGGNSVAWAVVRVNGLAAAAAKGAAVRQAGGGYGVIRMAAEAGEQSITVTYLSVCREGGLAVKDVGGCFKVGSGPLSIGGADVGPPSTVSNEYFSLASLSTTAYDTMSGHGMSWQEFYSLFQKYYAKRDYADQRVKAALDGTGMCSQCDITARRGYAREIARSMSVWMYVIERME